MVLPDRANNPPDELGMDILIVAAQGPGLRSRLFADQRYRRPAAVGGTPLALSAVSGEIVVCETGQTYSVGGLPSASVPPGANSFSRETAGPTLIERSSLPANVFSGLTLIRALPAGATVQLTEPAFQGTPEGDPTTLLQQSGAIVSQVKQDGLNRLVAPGAPFPTMERLEVAAVRIDASDRGGKPLIITH